MTVVSAHAEHVASRVVAVDVRKVLLSLLVLPFLAVGMVVRFAVRAVVWAFSFVWFAIVEGYQMAAPKDKRT